MERERAEREKEEAAIAANMHNTKQKLLNDLAEDEAKREEAVKKMQQMKDEEQKVLFSSLSNGEIFVTFLHYFHFVVVLISGERRVLNPKVIVFPIAETRTDALIDELMRTQRANDSQKVLEDMARERKEMEEMFTIKAGEVEKLRENEVLSEFPAVVAFRPLCFNV